MKIIDNTLECVMGKWSDPGPSVAGGMAALATVYCVQCVRGRLVVEAEDSDLFDAALNDPEEIRAVIVDYVYNLVPRNLECEPLIQVSAWTVERIEGRRATLRVEDFVEI